MNIADTIRRAAREIEAERKRCMSLDMTFETTRNARDNRVEACQTAVDNLLDEANRVERWME